MKEKALVWNLQNDCNLMCLVESGEPKQLMCFAELSCHATRKMGVTELSLEYHQVSQQMADVDGVSTPAPFRYEVKANPKTCVFEPKALSVPDPLDCRGTVLGAVYLDGKSTSMGSSHPYQRRIWVP